MSYEKIDLADFANVFGSTSTEISSAALNAQVVAVSDEFFAEAYHLLEVGPAPSLKGQFGPKGALFSGWETRRHNATYDWCIIKLGVPSGYIVGFDIDTAHFNGNEAPHVSVQALFAEPTRIPNEVDVDWVEILPKVDLGPSSQHLFKISQTENAFTHVKLNMYPDGGIARFRVYGIVAPIFPKDLSVQLDLAHVLSGGRVVAVSDQHFGVGPNLLLPGRGKDMGDGWETKRSRGANHTDWVIIQLGVPGFLEQIEIDTAHFKGNFPESCEVHAVASASSIPSSSDASWTLILARTKLGPHRRHFFQLYNVKESMYSHIKVTIFPDGGVKRIRVIGRRAAGTAIDPSLTAQTSIALPTLPSVPITSPNRAIFASSSNVASLSAVPLTREAFTPFGSVIQAWSDIDAAPRDIQVTTANQGTAFKFHSLARIEQSYDASAGAGLPRVSVFRSTPPAGGDAVAGGLWTVKLLERHACTNQVFIPMGAGALKGIEEDALGKAATAYLVIVAHNGLDDKPDLSTLRAFVASTSQGIAYATGIWHHPMISLETTIDFTCIETQIGTPDNQLDCEIVNVEGGIVQIPQF